jgi:hypothetical protein
VSLAKSLIAPENLLAEFSAEEIVESVVVSNLNHSAVTIVDTLVQEMPETVQTDSAIQRLVAEIDRIEKTYLPLAQDLFHSRILANPERYVLLLMVAGLGVGVLWCLLPLLGLVGLAAAIGALAFYIVVQWRVAQSLKQDIGKTREALVSKVAELQQRQDALLQQKG